jgi:hypothetical protein
MKKRLFLFAIFIISLFSYFISAAEVGNTIPIQVQTSDSSGNIVTGTFEFQINISSSNTCSPVLYSNTTTRTTDSRGIVTYTLEDVELGFDEQYWFCYYRDGVLKDTIKAARVPYAFRAKNTTLSGVEVDENLDLGGYNATAGYFIGDGSQLTNLAILGTISGIGSLGYIPMWNGTSSQNNSVIYQNGSNVGIGTVSPTATLHVLNNLGTGETARFRNAATNGLTDVAIVNDAQTWGFRVDGADVDNFKVMNFQTSTPVMTFLTGGNVGIGTTNPTQQLHLYDAKSAGNSNLKINTGYNTGVGQYAGMVINRADGPGDVSMYITVGTTDMGSADYYKTQDAITFGQGGGNKKIIFNTNDAVNNNLVLYNGNVGIGTTSPTVGIKLDVEGQAECDGAGCWTIESDLSLKENVVNLSKYGLNEIMLIKPREYDYKIDKNNTLGGNHSFGFIAQELKLIIPEIVYGEEGSMSIGYEGLTPVLVKAIQEQQQTIINQNNTINNLKLALCSLHPELELCKYILAE